MSDRRQEEIDFSEFKSQLSEYYEGSDYRWLRLCLFDLIPRGELARTDIPGTELFNILETHGEISYTDVHILSEVAELTNVAGAINHISEFKKGKQITDPKKSLTTYRKRLFKALVEVGPRELANIIAHYKLGNKEFKNIWDVVFHLERQQLLNESKVQEFADRLGPSTKNILLDTEHTFSTYPQQLIFQDTGHTSSSYKQQFQDVRIEESIRKCQRERFQEERWITPGNWNDNCEVNIVDIFTDLSLLKCKGDDLEQDKSTRMNQESRPILLQGLLNVIKTTRKVLITGEGGMGKTTLLKHIAYTWATTTPEGKDDSISGKLLFWINMRDVEPSTDIMDVIMKQVDAENIIIEHDLQDRPNSVKEFLFRHAANIVILFDGYDELESDKRGIKNPINVFKRDKWKYITVVLTSRPIFPADLRKSCEVHVEVKGFSSGNIKKYIKKYFNLRNPEFGKSLIETFKLTKEDTYLFGGDHKEAFKLCSSPMLLLQICDIWNRNGRLPNNLSDLFKEVILCILNQHRMKNGKHTIIEFDDISMDSVYLNAILSLGKVMYEGLKLHNSLHIKYNDPESLELELGFVYRDISFDPKNKGVIYTPPHKLLSEALAGFYMSVEIQKNSMEEAEYEPIRSNANLNMTRVFAIGFLGDDASKLLTYWLKHHMASHCYSVMKGLRHVKNRKYVLQQLDEVISEEPKLKEYCNEMCESFKSFLKFTKKYYEHGHVFNLMECIDGYYKKDPVELEKELLKCVAQWPDFRETCTMIVHISIIVQGLELETDMKYLGPTLKCLLKYIAGLDTINLNSLSDKMDKVNLRYILTYIDIQFPIVNSAFLIHFLHRASNLTYLRINGNIIAKDVLVEVINELYRTKVKLQLTELDIVDINLNTEVITLLPKLREIAPRLTRLCMSNCGLSGKIFNDWYQNINISECELKHLDISNNNLDGADGTSIAMLMKQLPQLIVFDIRKCNLSNDCVRQIVKIICNTNCRTTNVPLRKHVLKIGGNDLSRVDCDTLADLLRLMHNNTFKFSAYSLTARHLTSVIESSKNKKFCWNCVDLSWIDLSQISGKTLANLFNSSSDLEHVDMRNCKLTGRIIDEMMEECRKMNVPLKDNMLNLAGNDLSGIDEDKLAELVRIIDGQGLIFRHHNLEFYTVFKWSSYSLTVDNLKSLIVSSKIRKLCWKRVDLSGIDLSQISGKTLANLFKSSSDLEHVDMRNCQLTSSIIDDMKEECRKMKIPLEDDMLDLTGNDLSGNNVGQTTQPSNPVDNCVIA